MHIARTLILFALIPTVAHAVPMELNHQGRLTDLAGVPLSGNHDLTLRLYDVASGGSVLWSDTLSTSFDEGYFAVTLGSTSGNTLDDGLFDGSLYLSLEVDSGGELPRQSVLSVPFAVRAGTARHVEGGVVNASEIQIDGNTVIDATGIVAGDTLGTLGCTGTGEVPSWNGFAWTCLTPSGTGGSAFDALTCVADQVPLFNGTNWGCSALGADWSQITNVPLELLDGDDDLADTVCAQGELLAYDSGFGQWGCAADQVLTESDVETFVTNDPLDLAAGTTLNGADIATLPVDWASVSGAPSGLDDGDDDTLAALACTDGQLAAWDASGLAWTCADDADTITTTLDWTDLTGIPGGFADNVDDDALGALTCADGQIPAFETSGGAWVCVDDRVLTQGEVVGHVEAGGLDLSGSLGVGGILQIGDDGLDQCGAGDEGTLRWLNGALDVCNGAAWISLATKRDGLSQATAGFSCRDIKNDFPTSGSGNYWIDPDGGATVNAYQAYCEMTLHGGGWTLVLNMQTSDGNIRHYEDNVFWEGATVEGSLGTAFTADYKGESFTELGAIEIMMNAHNDGTFMGASTYTVVAGYSGNSLFTMFTTLSNTQITNGRDAVSGSVGTHGRARNAGDAFIDNPHPIVINSTYQPNDATNLTRLGTRYGAGYSPNLCSTTSINCNGHNFGGWGGRHFRGGWGTRYEGSAINGYCSTQGGFGSNGIAYSGNNAFNGNSDGCGGSTTSLVDVDMAVFVR